MDWLNSIFSSSEKAQNFKTNFSLTELWNWICPKIQQSFSQTLYSFFSVAWYRSRLKELKFKTERSSSQLPLRRTFWFLPVVDYTSFTVIMSWTVFKSRNPGLNPTLIFFYLLRQMLKTCQYHQTIFLKEKKLHDFFHHSVIWLISCLP